GSWIFLCVLAIAAIVTLLGGSLTTQGSPTNNPQSERAKELRLAAFARDPATNENDVLVIRSATYTVDSPRFAAYVRNFLADDEIPALASARTYLTHRNAGLVSQDRHATIVPIALVDDNEAKALVEKVQAADTNGSFAVAVTGAKTLDHDFNLLSQQDLE